MSFTISNGASLSAQRYLSSHTNGLDRSYSKLASGLRIQRPSDDAAGLAVATSLQTDSRILRQGIRNLSDGVSLISIAEGAVSELSKVITRLSELAQQSANGVYTLNQRRALDAEADQLVAEYNRIVEVTSFNGKQLFKDSDQETTLQAGYGAIGQLAISVGLALSKNVGTGSFDPAVTLVAGGTQQNSMAAEDLNGDGHLDIVTLTHSIGQFSVFLGNGDGTYKARFNQGNAGGAGNLDDLQFQDLNNDGILDYAFKKGAVTGMQIGLGNGDGTFKTPSLYNTNTIPSNVVIADVTGDGILDGIAADGGTNSFVVMAGNGDGTFLSPVSIATMSTTAASLRVVDLDGDGNKDVIIGEDAALNSFGVFLSDGNGGFRAEKQYVGTPFGGGSLLTPSIADLDSDGDFDLTCWVNGNSFYYTLLGNSDGSFLAPVSYALPDDVSSFASTDINEDGNADLVLGHSGSAFVSVLLGNGNGTFRYSATVATGSTVAYSTLADDFDGDGAIDIAVGGSGTGIDLAFSQTIRSAALPKVNILRRDFALEYLDETKNYLNRVSQELGNLGSAISRINALQSVLSQTTLNLDASADLIISVDVADEAAKQLRLSILQNFSVAVLTQANQQGRLILDLL